MTAFPPPERRASRTGRPTGLRLLPGGGEQSPSWSSEPKSRVQATSTGLLTADAEFAGAIPEADHQLAAGIHLPQVVLEAGAWDGPQGGAVDTPPAGLLVLDGLASRSVNRYGRPTIELFGPGDVIDYEDSTDEVTDAVVTWRVHQRSTLVDLDHRFTIAATRWPALWHVILRRSSMRANRLATQLAALQLPRIEDRLDAVLWQLANRWGRVTPDGVVVPLTLTHAMMGQLTAAQRSTVSVALAALSTQGQVTRRADGTWLLARSR